MKLTPAQEKQVIRWIKNNLNQYGSRTRGYDCYVAAEVCGAELNLRNHFDAILVELEYYVTNKY